MRNVEDEECGRWGMWKMGKIEDGEHGRWGK